MNPRVKNVIHEKDYTLHLWFTNGEEGIFDVKPYLDYEVFRALKDEKMFQTVRPFIGTYSGQTKPTSVPIRSFRQRKDLRRNDIFDYKQYCLWYKTV